MKKTLLVLLAVLLTVSFVFAEDIVDEHKFGKIVVGTNVGYLPQLKMATADINGRWQMDFDAVAPFTTDFVVKAGVITDFKAVVLFDGYVGAGLTKQIADRWDVYFNAGLDVKATKGYVGLGVEANTGFDYQITDKIAVNANVNVVEDIATRVILFNPSVGVNYNF